MKLNRRNIVLVLLVAAAVVSVGCFGMGRDLDGGNGDNVLSITIDRYDTSGATILNLRGPSEPSIQTVTYFIFGSATNFGGDGTVPLQHERLDEQQFGPLVYGDKLENVDLTPWDQYAFVYLRALGTQPNLAFRLDPDTRYEVIPK